MDTGTSPLAPVVGWVSQQRQGGKVDSWLSRIATLANPQAPAAAMLERLIGIDPQLHPRALNVLAQDMAYHGKKHDGTMAAAEKALGADHVQFRCLFACLGLVYNELCRYAGLKPAALLNQAAAQGLASAKVAARLVIVPPGLAGTGAILRLIGVPVMAAVHGKAYSAAWESLVGSTASVLDMEHAAFGYDHRAVGLIVAKAWAFPEHISKAILAPTQLSPTIDLGWCITVGSTIAHQLGYDGGAANAADNLPMEKLESVGVTMDDIARISSEVAAEMAILTKQS